MNGWQIAAIILVCLELGLLIAKHGEPKDGKYSIWHGLIGWGIWVFILIKGGFF